MPREANTEIAPPSITAIVCLDVPEAMSVSTQADSNWVGLRSVLPKNTNFEIQLSWMMLSIGGCFSLKSSIWAALVAGTAFPNCCWLCLSQCPQQINHCALIVAAFLQWRSSLIRKWADVSLFCIWSSFLAFLKFLVTFCLNICPFPLVLQSV